MSVLNNESGVPAVMTVQPTGSNTNNGNGWGGDWGAWIILFLIFGMFGWGGFGGGFAGNGGGALTRADLCQDMNFSQLENGVRGIQQGICDSTYALNNSINGLGMSVMQGFHGVDNAVCNLGFTTQQGFNATQMAMMQAQNALQTQAADCCCKTQTNLMQLGNQMERGFCDVNYTQATNANAIIQNAHNDTDRVIARLDAMENARKDERIAELGAKVQAYEQNAVFGARIDAATAEILRRSGHDCPTAAYIVQPPQPVSFATNCSGQATFNNGWNNGWNNGCGNGCGQCA